MLASVEEIIKEIKCGNQVILVDDEDRENEGDLIIAASACTPEVINFMAKFGRGLICLALTEERARFLRLSLQPQSHGRRFETAFTVSIEARHGVTTGISAADRSRTIAVAIDKQSTVDDLVTPGHIFPLIAKDGGVLVRAGHTEASVDLARLAGLFPAAVICEIMNDDGTMARMPDLRNFATVHNLKIGSIAELIAFRRQNESMLIIKSEHSIKPFGCAGFRGVIFENTLTKTEHLALVHGQWQENDIVPTRMHRLDVFSDVLHAKEGTLNRSLNYISSKPFGVAILLREPVPDALSRSLAAPPVHPVLREYGVGAQILRALGIRRIELLTTAEKNLAGLEGFGLDIASVRAV
jgi:3,4-dihydroxy 2-butanone 4-phosphate synthase/GTP cyclohydrolase II